MMAYAPVSEASHADVFKRYKVTLISLAENPA